MFAALAAAAPTADPDPDRAAPPGYSPRRFAGFLRCLIDCGKHLSLAVRLRAQRTDFPRFTQPFGTNYLPDILCRLGIAIRRAVLLEADALRQAGIWPPRRVRAASAVTARTVRQDDAPSPSPQPRPAARRARPPVDPHYANSPSIRKLAADICRRPLAAVLGDICRDLGITPRHPLWVEMCAAITAHGGSVEPLESDTGERWCSTRWLAIPFTEPPVWDLVFWPEPWSEPATAAAATATGPP